MMTQLGPKLGIPAKEKMLMFSRRSVFAPAALVITGFLGVSTANAQNTGCYTLESLQGAFGVVATYGSNVAIALGTRYHDVYGNLTGTFVLNQPVAGSTTGARTIQTGTNKGTFTVNCDGTGVITRTAVAANGTTVPAYDDFLITEGVVQNGKLVATSIVDAQRIPSGLLPGGLFLTRKYTRRPNPQTAGCYSLESLQGSYGVVVNYGVNLALGLQPETLDGKGNLSRTGVNNQPTAGSATGERTIGNVTSTGTYTVDCDGRGTITRLVTRPDGTQATAIDDFLILGGIEKDGKLIATTIFDAQRGSALVGPEATFVTRIHTLRTPLQITGSGTSTPPPQMQTVAVAGPRNVTVTSRQIQLDGSQSTSADGKPLIYLWTVSQGSPSAAIWGGTTATPTVQFAQGRGTYTFQLTVTDSAGKSSTDLVTVNYQGN